jgi:hypothetical protein
MSRASRRARGRRLDGAEPAENVVEAVASGTRQVGALTISVRDGAVGVDVRRLEGPTQAYDADFGWIDYKPGRLSVFFAKRSVADPMTLESRLQVRFPPEDFLNTFWNNSKEFREKLTSYVAAWPSAALETDEPLVSVAAARAHSVWASFSYTSHAGSEGSIDFYHMSTASIARYSQTRSTEGLRLTPVTRVQMTTFELFRLFQRAQAVIDQVEKDVPSVHRPPTAPKGIE